MSDIKSLVRPELHDLKPYSSARREASQGKIWLNANESPFTPATTVDKNLNRYPETQNAQLIQRAAKIYQVKPKQLLMTCGSDQSIDLLIRTFCRPYSDAILTTPPSFAMYDCYAANQAVDVVRVPLIQADNFALDVDAVIQQCNDKVKLVFLVTPNNPTGTLIQQEKIWQCCETLTDKALVIVDEAYNEFTEQPSAVKKLPQYKNLVILRTLSKAYALAGARIGFTIADPEVLHYMQIVLPPYANPTPCTTAALDVLQSKNMKGNRVKINSVVEQREMLAAMLATKQSVNKVYPSATNFLLVEFKNAAAIMKNLKINGIVVRDMSNKPFLENCLRITVGTKAENRALLDSL